MHVAIECEPRPRWSAVMHCPEHCQVDQIVEAIAVINRGCAAWLSILSWDTCGFQCQHNHLPNPPPSSSESYCFTSASSPLSISSPITSIPSIAFLSSFLSPLYPLSPDSTVLRFPGGRSTSPIPHNFSPPPLSSQSFLMPLLSCPIPLMTPRSPRLLDPACVSFAASVPRRGFPPLFRPQDLHTVVNSFRSSLPDTPPSL